MGDKGSGPYGDGGYEDDLGHPSLRRQTAGGLSDAEAERLLNGPWALTERSSRGVHEAGAKTGAENGDPQTSPTDLPGFGISAVAGRPARMAYSAGWDGADDPNGHAGARGPADAPETPGARRPEAVAGAPWPDRSVGSTDSGGETTVNSVSSVDFPIDLASPDAQAVARLLAAATAPPGPHELRGYEAARRAFERAGATPVRRSATLPLRRMIGVKFAAVAGALTVTGVAVAAEADVLPSPIQRVAHHMLGGVGVPDPEPDTSASGPATSASSSPLSTGPGTPRPTGPQASGTTSGNGAPLPGKPTGTVDQSAPGSSSSTDADVATLCRSYAAQQAGTGAALSGHDRRRLATLAGGEDKIPDYCARMLAVASTTPGGQPSDGSDTSSPASPSRDHKPTGTESSAPPPSATDTGPGNGNGHGHSTSPAPAPAVTPSPAVSPSHTPHLNKS